MHCDYVTCYGRQQVELASENILYKWFLQPIIEAKYFLQVVDYRNKARYEDLDIDLSTSEGWIRSNLILLGVSALLCIIIIFMVLTCGCHFCMLGVVPEDVKVIHVYTVKKIKSILCTTFLGNIRGFLWRMVHSTGGGGNLIVRVMKKFAIFCFIQSAQNLACAWISSQILKKCNASQITIF